jgi:hypothetical protein
LLYAPAKSPFPFKAMIAGMSSPSGQASLQGASRLTKTGRSNRQVPVRIAVVGSFAAAMGGLELLFIGKPL